ncbi:MAG: MAPEG family protein [Myxococcota bacterium]
MTTPLASLLAFAMWTLSLVLVGVGYPRVSAVLAGRAKPGDFKADEPHGGETYRRTIRAHLNCVENLPVFASVVLVGHAAGHASRAFDALAVTYVAARVGQSLAHVASGRHRVVLVRFSFFTVQVIAVIGMAVLIAVA